MARFLPALSLAAVLFSALPAIAVQPDEILPDPALEARARSISAGLRCLVCRNENIDDSNADLARDLRLLVRERLVAGDSDTQVVDYLVSRYGEYVLLNPTARGSNLLLWVAGPGALLIGLIGAGVYLRRRRAASEPAVAPLSDEEEKRLSEILNS